MSLATHARRRCLAAVATVLTALGTTALTGTTVSAQTVVLTAPVEPSLNTITPLVSVRAAGFGASRPLRVSVQVSMTADFSGSIVLDSAFTSADTIIAVQITRPLPSDGVVYLRAVVESPSVAAITSSVIGPKRGPPWLTLITPNSPNGDNLDVRRPLFVWRSAAATPKTGTWTYDFEIVETRNGLTKVAAGGLRDTTFRPPVDLEANASYKWSIRATLGTAAIVKQSSIGSFLITDPALPTTTIFYQNFPNPFPTANAFATCFWFDLGEPGGHVAIDILDVRGNFVRSVVSAFDQTLSFPPGRYGRGQPGAGSNCDNRFVWDGTAADGRIVAPGVYLVRFKVGNSAPIFRKALFRPQ
jgi:hypothetical protein